MVDLVQPDFIPNRQLIENVLLAIDLVKGYVRGSMTPRYMIKINFKKAYDSHKLPYIRPLMLVMGFQ